MSVFQSFAYCSPFNVFCISESWLSGSIYDHEIISSDYVLYRNDRASRGGGVFIAVHNSIPSSLICAPSDLEIVCISLSSSHIILCTVYIPPACGEDYLLSVINHLSDIVSSNKKCIIVGDFNLPDIHWSSLSCTSILSHHFCDFIFDFNLSQHVMVPTHTQGNVLDLVVTSPDVNISNLMVTHPAPCIASDHFIISFIPQCNSPCHNNHKPMYVFNFSKADYDSICSFLLDVDFSVCLQSSNIEFIWAVIKSVIYHAMCLFIPKFCLRSHQDPPWINSSIRHQTNCLRTLRRRFRSKPSPHIASKIDCIEKHLQQCIASAKSSYESQLLSFIRQKGTSQVFKYIRNITSHNSIPNAVYLHRTSANNDLEKANLFITYFHSIFTKSSFQCPNPMLLAYPNSTICEIFITEDEVFQALTSLDPSKAAGPDGIGPKLLKHCALALYQPLHHLFCLSICQSYIPQEWRRHLVKPIHKSGDKSLVHNYRPISLLCVTSKVLERIIFNHILSFINTKITTCQFGFMRHRSTLQQLLSFLHSIYNASSHCCRTDVVYLDFRKAFDSVAHNELLLKAWNLGIVGKTWYWLRTYLSNRSQSVSINSVTSTPLPVISGVPQGSILGPLLFLIFINDLPDVVLSSKVLLFADDAKCFKSISGHSDSLQLQEDLNRLAHWSTTWSLPFNNSKCSVISVNPGCQQSGTSLSYHLFSTHLSKQSMQNDLGVIVTSDLRWRAHLQSIMAKAYKVLGLLRRLFTSVGCPDAKRVLYVSLVQPKLLYCSPIWRPCVLSDIRALEYVQRRATKFILSRTDINYRLRLLHLRLLPLVMILEMNDIMFFIKSLKEPCNHFDISRYVTFSSGNTRFASSVKLRHSLVYNNSTRNFYFNRLPRLWNSLPVIDIEQSIPVIKRKLYQHFWEHFQQNFDPDIICSYHYLCPCSKCCSLPICYNYSSL